MLVNWIEAFGIVATSVGSAVLALLILTALLARRQPAPALAAQGPVEPTVFLFDERDLRDATAPARALLEAAPMGQSDWNRLSSFLAPRFDGFAERIAQLAQLGRIELTARAPEDGRAPMRLTAEAVGGLARITLVEPDAEGRGLLVDGLSQHALEQELDQLRQIMDHCPNPVWREDDQGQIVWANRAYLRHLDPGEGADAGLIWPLPRLFARLGADLVAPRRTRIEGGGARALWFDVQGFAVAQGALFFALPADATVRAEASLRDFVQTLTKTFADLPIGLAIFDRQRQLQLFNPALLDLTRLTPEFLSARPTLYAFLDRLREARMMPEPKDYASWRLQMSALEQASAVGFHTETWSLPNGQTYRVTGRPHPDGAVAFLFEDITSEIGLTRRFRAELEMGQEVLDRMDEAFAVFLASGELVLSNAAYGTLWGVEPETTLGRATLHDALAVWLEQSAESAFWPALRTLAGRFEQRETIRGTVRLRDGRDLSCRAEPMSGGALLVRFRAEAIAAIPRAPETLAG